MRRFRSIFVILVLVTSMLLVTPARSDGSGQFTHVKTYWGTDQPTEVSPGDVAVLSVALRYESVYSFKNLNANFTLPGGFEAVGGGVNVSTYYIGTISAGTVVELKFPIFVMRNAKVGNYTASLELEYYIPQDKLVWGLGGYILPQDRLEIAFEVTGRPSMKMEVKNSSIYEGRQPVLIALSNVGDAIAKSIKIARVYSSSASAELEGPKLLGDLQSGDSAAVPLTLFVPTGMKNKVLPLTVEVSCVGPKNVAYLFSETLQLPVKASSQVPPLIVNLDPRELGIGKSSKVYLDLKNTGGHSLSDIRLILTPDAILKVFGQTDMYIDRLGPEVSKRIETEIYVPSTTTAPTGSLTVDLAYIDEDVGLSQNESHRLNLLLRGLIEISLTDTAVIPSTPRSGTPFSITVTITNVGTSVAYAAYAIPSLENLPLNTFGPRSTYIGNIEINLPTTFTLNLQLQNTTLRSLTLPVTLSYMDNLRSVRNVTFSVPVTIAPSASTPSLPSQQPEYLPTGGLLIGAAAIAVIATVIIVIRRRRVTR